MGRKESSQTKLYSNSDIEKMLLKETSPGIHNLYFFMQALNSCDLTKELFYEVTTTFFFLTYQRTSFPCKLARGKLESWFYAG